MSSANPFLTLTATDILSVTQALINVESESKNEENLCDLLEEWIGNIRPDSKIRRVRNNLVVQIGDQDTDTPGIFAGHIDTVPAASNDGISNQSWHIDGERLYGLGSSDMKSGVAIMIALLSIIESSSTFVFYECEEIAEEFSGLKYLVENYPELLDAKWAVLLEPTDGQLELGCQGSVTVKAIFNGKRAHSARPWMGENAIQKSINVLDRALKESQSQPKVEIEGLTYTPALQITMIDGGTSGNVIPDRCVATINHRFSPDVSADQAKSYLIHEVCEGADEVEISSIFGGAMPEVNHPLVQFGLAEGRELVPKIGWTDVARFASMGIPAVNCGPGDATLAHMSDEHIEISKLNETYELLKKFVESI